MLWVDQTAVNIGLTLLPDIVKGIPQISSMEVGDIIEEATVVHVDNPNALMLDLGDGIRGFAPVRNVFSIVVIVLECFLDINDQRGKD